VKFKLKDNRWSHVKQRYFIDPPFWNLYPEHWVKGEYNLFLAVYPTKRDMDEHRLYWKPQDGYYAFLSSELEPLDEEASLVLVKMLLDVTD